MISKITPVSFKGTTEQSVENTETQAVSTMPITHAEPQVDTFSSTNKKSGNGGLLTGILGIMDMVNTLLSMTAKK